jgi:hypothetical protein
VKDGVIVKTLHVHNHESNPAGVEVTQIRNKIKKRAVETQEVIIFLKNDFNYTF